MAKAKRAIEIGPYSDKDYHAEMDLDTLIRAEQIKADKPRFERAQKAARERLEAVAAVTSAQPKK